MKEAEAPAAIGPAAYASWRATRLGAMTEAIEHRLMLDLLGDVDGCALLDIGCGDGALLREAVARGAKVTGIDPDPAMLAAARRGALEAGIAARLLEGRAEQLPLADASFDLVTAMTVLCFVADAAAALSEMARVLRPGGRLVIGELGRWSFWAAQRRLRAWRGSATWKAARFRTAAELRSLAEAAGLSVTVIRGAVFYPPSGTLARAAAGLDSWLGRLTTFGAAFIALHAVAGGPGQGARSQRPLRPRESASSRVTTLR